MTTNDREIQQLRQQLQEARDVIQTQVEELERFASTPLAYAAVLHVGKKRVTLARAGAGVADVLNSGNLKLKRGDAVLCTTDGGGVVEKANAVLPGEIASIQRILSDDEAEITSGNGTKIVLRVADHKDLREGDKVVLDATGYLILRILPRSGERFDMAVDTGVTWADIGGNEEAKAHMIEAVELPMNKPAVMQFYGMKPIKGVLLYGPPGCGKTMLGKAAATAIARANGTKTSGFMYVKGPEVLDPYVGVAEATVRSLFQRARAHKEEHGSPALIFIDEADALLANRSGRNAHMEKTIVPAFLAEMDGLEESGALVILATNRPDTLDPAITREGRIDRKVCVARPTKKDAEEIFRLNLKHVPLQDGLRIDEAVSRASEAVFSESRVFYFIETEGGQQKPFRLADLVSGAMIAGIIEQAKSRAMRRDMSAKCKPQGVMIHDILQAVDAVHEQNRDVDHTDALLHFAEGKKITNVRRMNHVAEAA